MTLTLAILVNHDEMSAINAVGLVVFLAGLTLHVTIKVSKPVNCLFEYELVEFMTRLRVICIKSGPTCNAVGFGA